MGGGEACLHCRLRTGRRHRADGAARGGKGLRRAGVLLRGGGRRRAASVRRWTRRERAPRRPAPASGVDTARCARCAPTWWSSARAWAAPRRRSRSPAAASTCSCSSAGSGCRASRRTGRRSAVFAERRYKPAERWLDGAGRVVRARACTTSSAATRRSTARACRASASTTSARSSTTRAPRPPGRSPTPTSSPTTPRRSASTASTAPPARTPPGRGAARRSRIPAVEHEPYVADLAARLRAQGVRPASNAMGIDLRPGGRCIRSPTCDGFPCPLGAKSDAETCAIDPALATGHARLETGVRVAAASSRTPAAAASSACSPRTRAAPWRSPAAAFVLAAGAVNSAALLLASADEKHPDGLANGSGQVGRNFMMHNNAHIVAVDLDRRNDVDVPEDAVGQRLVPRRRRRLSARRDAADRQGAGRDDEDGGAARGAAPPAGPGRAPQRRVAGHGRGPPVARQPRDRRQRRADHHRARRPRDGAPTGACSGAPSASCGPRATTRSSRSASTSA